MLIEKVILDYLNANIDGVTSYMERPEKLPTRFILIQKTGGGCENKIFSSTFAIQSYAESLYEAAALNDVVKSVMLEADSLYEIGSVRLNSDYNYTDGSTKQYRYQAVFDIKHY